MFVRPVVWEGLEHAHGGRKFKTDANFHGVYKIIEHVIIYEEQIQQHTGSFVSTSNVCFKQSSLKLY